MTVFLFFIDAIGDIISPVKKKQQEQESCCQWTSLN